MRFVQVYDYSAEEKQALLPWLDAALPLPPAPSRVATSAAAPGAAGAGAGARGACDDSGRWPGTRDRVRGMLLGLAIGDSLGNTSEGMAPAERRDIHGRAHGDKNGDVRDYLPNPREEGWTVGLPSDDTQLSFWTLESLLRRGGLDPTDLADTFTRQDRIYGIGSTLTAFLLAYRFGGKHWFEAGQPSAGNGALMRIAPLLLPHLAAIGSDLWRDVIVATALTHRDEAAVAASVGFAGLLAECLAWRDSGPPAATWWPETFVRYARGVETDDRYGARVPNDPFWGTLCDRVEQLVFPAIDAGTSVVKAADGWFSGPYLLETVPCVLLILARHAGEPEEALVRAVNDTWDNDTVAAVVGSAVGALHGEQSLPTRWREDLLGRTREQDDGHVQRLTERAVETFVG